MNRLAEILLKKSLDECSVHELLQLTEKYPYFNAGHLLAVQKLQAEGSDQLSKTLQKASLHFHSVHIDRFLSGKGNAEIIQATSSTPVTETTEPANNESNEIDSKHPDFISEAHPTVNNELEEKAIADLPTEDLVPHEEKLPDVAIKEDNEIQLPITSNEQQATTFTSDQIDEQIITSPDKQDTEFDSIQSSHNDELILSRDESERTPAHVDENVDSNIKQPETRNLQPETDTTKPETGNEQFAFEPFHTVDYFASQGIKVKLDENPTDKFSKQLKSFTEWLKTLKKLPDNENIPTTNTVIEKKVDQLAETSLTDSNVVTEAMAEVWAKQGNHEKAIDIYHKLSLLEPAKSTYFASLIEDLKKTSL